jgi:hypothetical protein
VLVAQGFVSDYVTHDVDFTPATDHENLDRLSAALTNWVPASAPMP